MIIAVDFDGTLVEHEYPKIGKPNLTLVSNLRKMKEEGHKLILWTCRQGKFLEEAVEYCKRLYLEFDAVNDNVPESMIADFKNTRKVMADFYIDDRAILLSIFNMVLNKEIQNDII